MYGVYEEKMKCPKCGHDLEFTETVANAMDYYICHNCKKTTDKHNWWYFHKENKKRTEAKKST